MSKAIMSTCQKVIKQWDNFRILEVQEEYYEFEDLCGDMYNPKVNTGISPETLAREKEEFRQECEREGVWGYVLEKWNPEIGIGWEHISSCHGFVGQYDPSNPRYNHYIVAELESEATK